MSQGGLDFRAGLADDEREREQMLLDALRATTYTLMPGRISENIDKNGQYSSVKLNIQRRNVDQQGNVTWDDYPELQTVPVHFTGGGGETKNRVITTHPMKKGSKDDGTDSDEISLLFASRGIDNWEAKGGSQTPPDSRRATGAALSDAIILPGLHSKPNLAPFYDPDSHMVRSHNKDHVSQVHPNQGIKHKSASKWSDNEDPWAKATEFYHHLTQAANGVESVASRNNTQHQDLLNHDDGFKRNVNNDKHHYNLHPSNGHEQSFNNNQHTYTINSEGHKQDYNSGQSGHKIDSSGHTLYSQSGQVNVNAGQVNVNAPTTNIQQQLDVGGLASLSGGLLTGALEVAADADGGLVHATMGFKATGGMTTDTLFFSQLPPTYATDVAAAAGGLPVGGVYVTSAGVLHVRLS